MAIRKFENDKQFDEILHIIEESRKNALRKVNEELIMMYWRVGEYISLQSENASYGDSYIQSLADFFSQNYPQIKGFNRRGLYRMKQFYETYKDDEKVSTLLTQLSWSNHIKLLSACKTNEERLFYMQLGQPCLLRQACLWSAQDRKDSRCSQSVPYRQARRLSCL